MKATEEKSLEVTFTFGLVALVTVTMYEGLTIDDCLRFRSDQINGYFSNGEYHKVSRNK